VRHIHTSSSIKPS